MSLMLRKYYFFALLLFLLPTPASAETKLEDLENMSLADLGEVVTSVSKRPEPAFEAASAVYVITQEDLKQLGVRSIAEALRIVPGLQVAEGTVGFWSITSRGLNDTFGNKLLVLQDGLPVNNTVFAGTYWNGVNYFLEDVDRIEVIRGPGATLWGAGAVNGVINIITKKSEETQGVVINGGAGNKHLGFGGIRYGGRVGENVSYRGYFRYQELSGDEPIGEFSTSNGWDESYGGGRVDIALSESDSIVLQSDFHNGAIDGIVFVPALSGLPVGPISSSIEDQGYNFIATWNHQIDESSSTNFRLYYDRLEYKSVAVDLEISTAGAEFEHNWKFSSRNELTWGANYKAVLDHIVGTDLTDFTPKRTDLNFFGVFAQNKFDIVPEKIAVTFGTKIEHNDYTDYEIQPNVRFSWQVNDKQTVWGAVSRAVKLVNRAERDVNLLLAVTDGGDVRLFGNRDFDSENTLTYELGYRVKATPNLQFDISAFYTKYDDLRTSRPFMPMDPNTEIGVTFVNDAEADSWGVEVAADWKVQHNWRLAASYSFLKLDVDSNIDSSLLSPDLADVLIEDLGDKSPKNQFNVRSYLYLPQNLEFSTMFFYVENLPGLSIPSYTRVDSRLSWGPNPNLELSLVGQNMFDDDHQEFGGPIQTVNSAVGRSFYAMATLRF